MKKSKNKLMSIALIVFFSALFVIPIFAQEEEKPVERPVRSTFESNWIIDNQTVMVPFKGTFEMDIQHRFGTWDNGYDDLWGIFAPSNIRIAFSYVLIDKLQFGFGITKEKKLVDFNAKYALLRQTRSGKMPISLTYYTNVAMDTRNGDNFFHTSDRLSYFHQLMLARKISDKFSIQASINLSHFNAVEAFINEEIEIEGKMENDHISYSLMSRIKLKEGTSFLINYDQPITKHLTGNPNPNISLGFEFVTSSHAFQIFAGNYKSIIPQYNNTFNNNDFGDNEILIGFNITRLWNF